MKNMTAAQYRKAQAQEFDQIQAIESVETVERVREESPQVLDSANPAPYVKVSVPVRGIFQDAYGVNEIDIPFKDEGEIAQAGRMFSGLILRIDGDQVVQKIGRDPGDVKAHTAVSLSRVPAAGEVVDIVVGKDGRGVVSERGKGLERG